MKPAAAKPAEAAAPERDELMGELAPFLVTVARIAGVRAALRVAEELGGRELFLAKAPGPQHPLARVIGLDAAVAVAERWGARYRVYVPRADQIRERLAIRDLYEQGLGASAIARRLGTTVRQVRRVVTTPESPALASLRRSLGTQRCPLCGRRHGRAKPAHQPAHQGAGAEPGRTQLELSLPLRAG